MYELVLLLIGAVVGWCGSIFMHRPRVRMVNHAAAYVDWRPGVKVATFVVGNVPGRLSLRIPRLETDSMRVFTEGVARSVPFTRQTADLAGHLDWRDSSGRRRIASVYFMESTMPPGDINQARGTWKLADGEFVEVCLLGRHPDDPAKAVHFFPFPHPERGGHGGWTEEPTPTTATLLLFDPRDRSPYLRKRLTFQADSLDVRAKFPNRLRRIFNDW